MLCHPARSSSKNQITKPEADKQAGMALSLLVETSVLSGNSCVAISQQPRQLLMEMCTLITKAIPGFFLSCQS